VLNAITRNNTASPKRYGGGKAIPVHTHFNSLLHLPVEKSNLNILRDII
jgi:hypothetical protein